MKLQFVLAWYAVKDLEAAKKFYGEVLGMKNIFEMPGWAEYAQAKGSAAIGLAAPRPDAARCEPAAGATVVLGVDNMDDARKQLGARGVKFDGGVEEIPGVVRLSTFSDPFGNRIQLAQSLLNN